MSKTDKVQATEALLLLQKLRAKETSIESSVAISLQLAIDAVCALIDEMEIFGH